MAYTPPAGATQNAYGYWVLPSGDLAPGQTTPGMQAEAASGTDRTTHWTEQGAPYWLVNGQKYYIAPAIAAQSDDPKLRSWSVGKEAPGQSYLKNAGTWNPQTGEYDRGPNWTNLLSTAVGAGLGAGVLSAVGGAGGAAGGAAGATPEGGSLASVGGGIGEGVADAGTTGSYAAGAGSAGVGVGETGAVTGLEGSGFGAGAGTTAAALPAAQTVPLATAGLPSGVASSGAVPAAATVAAGTGAISWGQLAQRYAPEIIGAGTQLIGANIAANASTDAANIQAQTAQKALDQQEKIYEQQRGDLAPYRAAGQGSIGKLSYGLGVPGFEGGPVYKAPLPTLASPAGAPVTQTGPNNYLSTGGQQSTPPTAQTNQGYNKLGQPIPATGTATVRAPTGEQKVVPAGEVAYWVSKGATVLPATGA